MARTYDIFRTDSNLEQNGIFLNLGEAGTFRIARAGGSNKEFSKLFQKLTHPHRRAIQTENMDENVAKELLIEAYSKKIMLGWEGVTGEDDKPLPFSIENAAKLLRDLPWLFEEIRRAAEDASIFRSATLKVDSGNSVGSSAT